MASLLLALVTAHLLVDFVIIRHDEGAGRAPSVRGLVTGAVLHAVVAYALCGVWRLWAVLLTVVGAHLVIDVGGAVLGRAALAAGARQSSRRRLVSLVIRQSAHVAVLVALATVVAGRGGAAVSFWHDRIGPAWDAALVVAAGAIVTIRMGGVVVALVVEPFLAELRAARLRKAEAEVRGLERGGLVIGYLERALIFFLTLADMSTGVGFLIAAKSIFRFGELKERSNRMEAEYIIIGTFMSFTWAIVASWSTRRLLDLV